MDWREGIVIDPKVRHGAASVKGTQILVSVNLDNLAAGFSPEEVIKSYPGLQPEDIRVALAHATELAREKGCAGLNSPDR